MKSSEIYKEFTTLCKIAFKIVKCVHLSKDIVQDTYLKIYSSSSEIEKRENYLKTAVKNISYNYLRNRKRTFELKDFGEVEKSVNSLILRLDKRRVGKIRKYFTDRQDEIFNLKYICNLTNSEIVNVCNISKKTLENHITKINKILKLNYEKV